MVKFVKWLFHIHSWKYTSAEYDNDVSEKLAIPKSPATRTCTNCGVVQYQDKHCLGLNPPQYVTTWIKIT